MYFIVKVILTSFILLTLISFVIQPITYRSTEQAIHDKSDQEPSFVFVFLDHVRRMLRIPLLEGYE